MTRPIQKQEELCSLKHIFKRLGIVPKAIHCGNDPPDFLVALEEQEIALELTAYHLDGQRREVEEHWGKICTAWSEMQKVYPELAKVDVYLVLKKYRLPAPKNYSRFLQDLAKSIRDMQHRSGQNEENFFPSSDRHPELARFVAKVEIAAVEFHGGLDWDKSFAYTGLTEYDLIRLMRRKLLAPYIQEPKLRWLLYMEDLVSLALLASC